MSTKCGITHPFHRYLLIPTSTRRSRVAGAWESQTDIFRRMQQRANAQTAHKDWQAVSGATTAPSRFRYRETSRLLSKWNPMEQVLLRDSSKAYDFEGILSFRQILPPRLGAHSNGWSTRESFARSSFFTQRRSLPSRVTPETNIQGTGTVPIRSSLPPARESRQIPSQGAAPF